MTYGYSAEELLTQCAATCRKKKEKICGSLRSYQRERNEELMLLEYESSPLFYDYFHHFTDLYLNMNVCHIVLFQNSLLVNLVNKSGFLFIFSVG